MKIKAIFILILFVSVSIRVNSWAELFNPAGATLDDLVFHTVRYGNTEEKRQNKQVARAELFSRRGDALRFVMTKIHLENVGIQVLGQELVNDLKKDEAVPVLLDFVNDAHTNTQKTAIYFLGYYNAPEKADVIKPLLAEDKLRGVAIRTLGKWKVANAVPAIAKCLHDDNERVRVAAANALRDIGDARAVPALIDAQDDPVFTVRNTALRALVSLGKASEAPMLAALDKARGVKLRQLIRGLGLVNSANAKKSLLRLAKHPDPAVRADAARALMLISLSQ